MDKWRAVVNMVMKLYTQLDWQRNYWLLKKESYSEVSWIATNKFNHNELRSYRGNIVTGLPLQEWLTTPL